MFIERLEIDLELINNKRNTGFSLLWAFKNLLATVEWGEEKNEEKKQRHS